MEYLDLKTISEDKFNDIIDEMSQENYKKSQTIKDEFGLETGKFNAYKDVINHCFRYFNLEKEVKGDFFFAEELQEDCKVDSKYSKAINKILPRKKLDYEREKTINSKLKDFIEQTINIVREEKNIANLVERRENITAINFKNEEVNIITHADYSEKIKYAVELWEVERELKILKYPTIPEERFDDIFFIVAKTISADRETPQQENIIGGGSIDKDDEMGK